MLRRMLWAVGLVCVAAGVAGAQVALARVSAILYASATMFVFAVLMLLRRMYTTFLSETQYD